jgi:hypothetical protein
MTAPATYFKGELETDTLVVNNGITSDTPTATTSVAGLVKKGVAVANITPAADGTTAGTALNALLASLRTAGIIVT